MNRLSTEYFSPGEALAGYGAVMSLLIVAGVALSALGGDGDGLLSIVVAQLFIIAGVPVTMAAIRHRRRFAAALGVHRPSWRGALGALLCGASFWYLNWQLVGALGHRLFGESDELRHLERAVSEGPVAWVLIAVALVPALCEELLLRGLVLRALRPVAGPVIAIIFSAALFSLMHLTRVQLLPTFAFGLLLGYAALKSGVATSMIAHLVNNTVALLLATGLLGRVAARLSDALFVLGPAAALVCLTGIVLLRTQPHKSADLTKST